jgi:hypothetical protein
MLALLFLQVSLFLPQAASCGMQKHNQSKAGLQA